MDRPIRKVVIVGRDAAAWLSALALQLNFGRTGVEIELVELPSALRSQDVYVTLPAQQAFHRLLGLDENRLLRACSGLYTLGQRFANWSGSGAPFLHAYDTHGIALNRIDFFQYWLKARANGLKVPLEEFSLGAVAALQGRFVVFNETTRPFSNATYGYNLGAIPYLQAIGKAALKAGLRHTATIGAPRSVEQNEGRIKSITLQSGSTVEGDLFIDASGPEGCLIKHLERDNLESWQAWMPCDRLLVASAPRLSPVPAFSQIPAFREGWLGIYPLMNRTALVVAFASEYISDQDMPQTISALSGMRIEGGCVISPLSAGARLQHWIGNCVALGDTAINPAPLDGLHLQPLNIGLSYLISLFPADRNDMKEAAIYNSKLTSFAAGLRDFQISHFKLNRRFDQILWDKAREQSVPETLARKLRLFESRGIISMDEHETFQEENWTSIFIGHNLVPRSWDPLVDKMSDQDQIANFQRILGFIAAEVKTLPSLQAQIELNAPGSSGFTF